MIKKVVGLHYSPAGGTAKMTRMLTQEIAKRLEECSPHSIAVESMYLSAGRDLPEINEETVVILGMPVYVGKIPLPGIKLLREIEGRGAMTLALVAYSGHDYGNALYELTHFADERGLSVVGAGAIAITYVSLRERNFGKYAIIDIASLNEYADAAAAKIRRLGGCDVDGLKIKPAPLEVRGKLPMHRISRISPRAAAIAQMALDRVPIGRKESEWFL